MKFEENIKELEGIIAKMEDKNTTLDESIELFNKGVAKSSECLNMLTQAKGKVELLVKELEEITKTELDLK